MFSGMRFTVFVPLEVPTKMSSSTLRKSINFLNRLKSKRNSVFATNFYFLITMSLEPNLCRPWVFQTMNSGIRFESLIQILP